jgi:hypothetical protein
VPADKVVNPMQKTSAKHGFTFGGYFTFNKASFANSYGAYLYNLYLKMLQLHDFKLIIKSYHFNQELNMLILF